MVETLKYATISDIYTRDLVFYDPENYEKNKEFCADNGITYLPDKSRNHCFRLENEEFKPCSLSEVGQCQPNDLLFSEDTLKKFGNEDRDNVLFVIHAQKIVGVVHIVDYNHEFLFFEFYKLIHHFEKNLRALLINNDESNETFLNWVVEKAAAEALKAEGYFCNLKASLLPENVDIATKLDKKRKDLSEFQTFNLSDLLRFASSKEYFKCNSQIVTDLRNWVAHSKDIIKPGKDDERSYGGFLYNFDEFSKFVKNAICFFNYYEELEARSLKS